MQYLISQFALWLAVALVLGLVIGFWAVRRAPTGGDGKEGPRDGRLWTGLYLVLILAGAGVAAIRAVKDLNGLWFDTLVLFAAAYLIGCVIGALLAGGAGRSGKTAGAEQAS